MYGMLRSLLAVATSSLLFLATLASTADAAGTPPRHIHKSLRNTSILASGATIFTDAGPEPLLAKIFDAIEQSRLDFALQQAELLIKAYPTFRLAHLIKGDLLLARTRPLTAFGQGGRSVAEDKVTDLREEAIVRLKGYRSKPLAGYVPRYLLQMMPEQNYAMVIDTQKSRLYLYNNDDGIPRFVADYYITQGKLGADKVREGDRKTPIGVYHITSSLSHQKLGDFYGSGAFPLNYPNEWDKRQGRNGHGIWLHGTPSDTFSRPPKASDGCIVLANQDMDVLAKNIKVGLTPVIISNSIEWLSLDDWQRERNSLLEVMEEWRQDWESRDMERYARHYSREFNVEGQTYATWIAQKHRVNASKSWIKVDIGNISMFRNPGKEEYVVVTFEQDYRSNNLVSQMKKRQYWIREDGRWKIVAESAA